jgi:hypothetical protein
MTLDRREMILALTGIVGFIEGARQKDGPIRLVLDATPGIEVIFQGRKITITPAEIMASLTKR